jgi:DNA-binding MarR family transcriptional regulator
VEQVAQPTMSVLVARLEADGLVSRSGEEADGRTVVISITAAGRRSLVRIRERRAASLQRTLAWLSAADREVVAAALPALTQLTEKMDEQQAVGAVR